MKGKTRLRILVTLMFVMVAVGPLRPAAVFAAESDINLLNERIKVLSERVKTLEAEVDGLKQQLPSDTKPMAAPAPPAVGFREAWRDIHDGLTREEVRKILGAPQHEFDLSGKHVWYYYYSGTGGGSVFFSVDGHVAGSQEPPRSW